MDYMEKIYFATHNQHKLTEVQAMLRQLYSIHGAGELEAYTIPEEDADTLLGNATIKARALHAQHGVACIADDTGLLVDALDGAPGVHSARYGGADGDDSANRERLLRELSSHPQPWSAHFETVIVLIDSHGREHHFVGAVHGKIIDHEEGNGGFGYDSLFVPEGFSDTFATMSADEKNSLSHRARAVEQLYQYLSEHSL